MLEAAFWGFIGGSSLVIGAAAGLKLNVSRRVIGLVMGFGAGVLISALAFELTADAFRAGGTAAVSIGLAAGALAFYFGDLIIDRRGGEHRKHPGGRAEGSANALLLGAVLDGIPESMAIGASLTGGKTVGLPILVAVFLSNVPEGLASARGMRLVGHRPAAILGIWAVVAAVAAAASALGFAVIDGASGTTHGLIQAFAGGAVLTMLADTMMPTAFEEGGRAVGLVTVLGFALAFLLSHVA